MHRSRQKLSARVLVAVGLVILVVAACGAGAASPSAAPTAAGASAAASASSPAAIDTSGVALKVATYPVAIGSDETLLKAAGLLDTPYAVTFQTYPDGGTQTSAVLQGTADISRGSGVANALLAGGSETRAEIPARSRRSRSRPPPSGRSPSPRSHRSTS